MFEALTPEILLPLNCCQTTPRRTTCAERGSKPGTPGPSYLRFLITAHHPVWQPRSPGIRLLLLLLLLLVVVVVVVVVVVMVVMVVMVVVVVVC